jgi:RNA polymerase sigma-70 factor (ECF subfamily)
MTTRRRQAVLQPLDGAEAEQLVSVEDVLEQVLRLEEDGELVAALATVSAEQRRVLELRFFADLDLHEIALITSVPLGTVKSRLHRALTSLRQRLGPAQVASRETKP